MDMDKNKYIVRGAVIVLRSVGPKCNTAQDLIFLYVLFRVHYPSHP